MTSALDSFRKQRKATSMTTADDIVERLRRALDDGSNPSLVKRLLAEIEDRLRAQPATPREEGDWVLVPREPVGVQKWAGCSVPVAAQHTMTGVEGHVLGIEESAAVYRAMIAAAPTPSSTVTEEVVERALEAYQRVMFDAALNVNVTGEAMTGAQTKLAEAVFKGRQKAAMRAALQALGNEGV